MGDGNSALHRGVTYRLFKRKGAWAFAVSASRGVESRMASGWVSSQKAAAAARDYIDSELKNTNTKPRSAA